MCFLFMSDFIAVVGVVYWLVGFVLVWIFFFFFFFFLV